MILALVALLVVALGPLKPVRPSAQTRRQTVGADRGTAQRRWISSPTRRRSRATHITSAVVRAVTQARAIGRRRVALPDGAAEDPGHALAALAVAEAYPELQADETSASSRPIGETMNRIAVSRQVYNDTVPPTTTRFRPSPAARRGGLNFLARVFGPTIRTRVPQVDFSPDPPSVARCRASHRRPTRRRRPRWHAIRVSRAATLVAALPSQASPRPRPTRSSQRVLSTSAPRLRLVTRHHGRVLRSSPTAFADPPALRRALDEIGVSRQAPIPPGARRAEPGGPPVVGVEDWWAHRASCASVRRLPGTTSASTTAERPRGGYATSSSHSQGLGAIGRGLGRLGDAARPGRRRPRLGIRAGCASTSLSRPRALLRALDVDAVQFVELRALYRAMRSPRQAAAGGECDGLQLSSRERRTRLSTRGQGSDHDAISSPGRWLLLLLFS